MRPKKAWKSRWMKEELAWFEECIYCPVFFSIEEQGTPISDFRIWLGCYDFRTSQIDVHWSLFDVQNWKVEGLMSRVALWMSLWKGVVVTIKTLNSILEKIKKKSSFFPPKHSPRGPSLSLPHRHRAARSYGWNQCFPSRKARTLWMHSSFSRMNNLQGKIQPFTPKKSAQFHRPQREIHSKSPLNVFWKRTARMKSTTTSRSNWVDSEECPQ